MTITPTLPGDMPGTGEAVRDPASTVMPSRLVRLPHSVPRFLRAFERAYGLQATVWLKVDGKWATFESTLPDPPRIPPEDAVMVRHWGSGGSGAAVLVHAPLDAKGHNEFLAEVISDALRHEEESRAFGREIGERYEEITLLYTISEILGSIISLDEATAIILEEVAETLAVQRASLWLHDPEHNRLELIAAHGTPGLSGPIDLDDPVSVTAMAFRERRPINLEYGEQLQRAQGIPKGYAHASLLSVPVSYSPPDGDVRTIGVINLIGRGDKHRFDAGNQKMMMAIASQIGAAVENSRLAAASVREERMAREMELAHDLQMKLLPRLEQFDGYAQVAARCVPAASVGGDFYHLFRLSEGRIGVMIGDVSSHGFGAALIMALTMSAVAIHASEGDSPGEVLRRTHRTLVAELETTEMYMTLFYGVIDPRRSRLTFTNAGHAHAFQLTADGQERRLEATNPPLGIIDLDSYREETISWSAGDDLLLLFTDGLSDALNLGEIAGSQRIVDEVRHHHGQSVEALLDRLYDLVDTEERRADDRTAVLVRI